MQRRICPDVVKELTLTTINPFASVTEAAVIMMQKNIGALVVVQGYDLVGIVTERDMLQKILGMGQDPQELTVRDIMSPNPDTVSADTTAATALEMMVSGGYRHLPIVSKENGMPIGMVSVRDLYMAVQEGLNEDLQACEAYVLAGEGYGASH